MDAGRIRTARTVDVIVGALPLVVLAVLALTSVTYAFADRDRLAYTALAPAAFIGPALLWARMLLGRRRADSPRTIGEVLVGVQPACSSRERSLRVLAAVVAVASALGLVGAALAFTGAFYWSGAIVGALLMGGPPEVIEAADQLAAEGQFQSDMERAKLQVVTALADEEYERIIAMTDERALPQVEAFIEGARTDAIICYANETDSVGYSGEIGEASFTLWEYVRESDGSKTRRRILIDFQGAAGDASWRLVGLMRSTVATPVEFVPDGTGVWER